MNWNVWPMVESSCQTWGDNSRYQGRSDVRKIRSGLINTNCLWLTVVLPRSYQVGKHWYCFNRIYVYIFWRFEAMKRIFVNLVTHSQSYIKLKLMNPDIVILQLLMLAHSFQHRLTSQPWSLQRCSHRSRCRTCFPHVSEKWSTIQYPSSSLTQTQLRRA